MMITVQTLLAMLAFMAFPARTSGFINHPICYPQSSSSNRFASTRKGITFNCATTSVQLKKYKYDDSFFDEEDEENEDENITGPVTREMLLRDMLKVKRKKKNGKQGYRTLDNRDSLPYVVKLITPDPYTPNAIKKAEAKQNIQRNRKEQQLNPAKSKNKKVKRTDLVEHGIAASIYAKSSVDGSLEQVLGEFKLDKSTQSGDIITVGDVEYEVQVARCQYKYAGGKRFVMVRKILEVKEIARVVQEESIKRALQIDVSNAQGIHPDEVI